MKLEFLKLVLPGLPVRLCGKLLPRGDFKFLLIPSLSISQTLSQSLKHSLSVSQTLSKFKYRNQSNAHRQMLTVLGVQRKSPSPSNALLFPQTTFRRSPHPSLEITQMLAVKRSPSSACNEITVTVKRYPLSSDHILTIPSSIPRKSLLSLPTEVQILLCLKV